MRNRRPSIYYSFEQLHLLCGVSVSIEERIPLLCRVKIAKHRFGVNATTGPAVAGTKSNR